MTRFGAQQMTRLAPNNDMFGSEQMTTLASNRTTYEIFANDTFRGGAQNNTFGAPNTTFRRRPKGSRSVTVAQTASSVALALVASEISRSPGSVATPSVVYLPRRAQNTSCWRLGWHGSIRFEPKGTTFGAQNGA